MTKWPGNRPPWSRSVSKQSKEIFQSRFSLNNCPEGLLKSLLHVVLDSSECNPRISERHKEKKESEDLTESPVTFLVTLIGHVALKGKLDVDNEEEVGDYKARQANIEKCSMNFGVHRRQSCLFSNLQKQKLR
jgi:hypothetical protein